MKLWVASAGWPGGKEMAKDRTYFAFYFSFRDAAKTMKPKQRDAFYNAIIEYAATGVEPTLPASISGYWPIVKPALDTSKKRYEAGKSNEKSQKECDFASTNGESNGSHKEKEERERKKDKEEGRKKNIRTQTSTDTSTPSKSPPLAVIGKCFPCEPLQNPDTEELRAAAIKRINEAAHAL